MNDYGSSPFDAGFGRPVRPYSPPPGVPPLPPRREAGVSRPFLVVLLLLACVLLGGLLNWGLRQRAERARLFERNIEVEQSYVTVLAKRNDLASFLTDPRTRLYRLGGVGRAAGRGVTVAWQAETGNGVLIGDEVPLPADGRAYAVWRVDGAGRSGLCGTFRPESGVTFFNFRGPVGGGEARGFRVSEEGGANPAAPGAVVYEAR